MDRTNQMARELENMLSAGEIDTDINEIKSVVDDLKTGSKTLNDFYSASTPHKLLTVFDIVNQRVKR
jgi:predicted metal-dependent enzyme (double-stranded beta helix superfamily)